MLAAAGCCWLLAAASPLPPAPALPAPPASPSASPLPPLTPNCTTLAGHLMLRCSPLLLRFILLLAFFLKQAWTPLAQLRPSARHTASAPPGYLLRSLLPFLTCIYGTLLDLEIYNTRVSSGARHTAATQPQPQPRRRQRFHRRLTPRSPGKQRRLDGAGLQSLLQKRAEHGLAAAPGDDAMLVISDQGAGPLPPSLF